MVPVQSLLRIRVGPTKNAPIILPETSWKDEFLFMACDGLFAVFSCGASHGGGQQDDGLRAVFSGKRP